MPARERQLNPEDLAAHVADHVFSGPHDEAVGIELEWLCCPTDDWSRRPTLAETRQLIGSVGPLPRSGNVTMEPGGQLELSTLPYATASDACEAAADDLYALEVRCAIHGYELVALGADPVRPPRRVTDAPRYEAMQQYFDERGLAGLRMMTNTAAIQLNVGLGRDRTDIERRWRLANHLGPVLIAAFANSPLAAGRPTGWLSSRLRAWWQIDPSRTAPVTVGVSPAEDWLRYALDANVMLIRRGIDTWTALEHGFSFARWLEEGHRVGWPTVDDFAYHLTTLFPPIRPRGWLEIRVFDAIPTPFWHVAVALTTTLLDSREAEGEIDRAVDGTTDLWIDAAQLGLAHPELARAAPAVFEVALDELSRSGDASTVAVVEHYLDRWIARGRCPGDDRIDDWRRTGRLHPISESPIRYVDFDEALT